MKLKQALLWIKKVGNYFLIFQLQDDAIPQHFDWVQISCGVCKFCSSCLSFYDVTQYNAVQWGEKKSVDLAAEF